MAVILCKTEHHWKTKERVTIEIQNAFGIPAPTVHMPFLFLVEKCLNKILSEFDVVITLIAFFLTPDLSFLVKFV